MRQPSLLSYQHYRYLKLAVVLALVSLVAYFWHEPVIRPNGGTWLGYTLGTLAAGIILLLLSYGVRKRSYHSNLGTVQGWLSAHVYLGVTLVLIATLHTGFQFAWNVHTLVYFLMLAVVASGFLGLYFYRHNPELMSLALHGSTLDEHLLAINEIDNDSRVLAMNHVDHINKALLDSLNAPLFDSFWQQFTGDNPHCKTRAVSVLLATTDSAFNEAQARVNADLYRLQLQKLSRLNRLRGYMRHKAWLDIWLLLYVPLSIALLAALVVHIISVFFY
jgi:hypothetical protein